MLVERHQPLPASEESKAPFFSYSEQLRTRLVATAGAQEFDIIRPQDIISHLVTWRRVAGTYGIGAETILLCWGLDHSK